MNDVSAIDRGPSRLLPEMRSRKLQVLDFVTAFITRWGKAPSLSEIASHHGVSPQRVKALLDALVREGKLLRNPGARGLALPCRRAEILRELRAQGWVVDEDALRLVPPFTKQALLPRAALDYPAARLDRDVAERGDRGGNFSGAGVSPEEQAR